MGFSRQEYWSGMPFSSPGDLPDPRIESVSLMSPALAGVFFTTSRSLYTDRYLNLAIICPNFHTQDNFFPFKETMYFYIYLSPKIYKLQTEPSKAKSAAWMCLPSLYYQCALIWQKRKLMFMWFYKTTERLEGSRDFCLFDFVLIHLINSTLHGTCDLVFRKLVCKVSFRNISFQSKRQN